MKGFYILFAVFFLFPSVVNGDEKLTGNDIILRADKVMIGNSAKYNSIMTVQRPDMDDVVAKFTTYFKERGGKTLIRLLYPPKEKGKDLLLLEENMWQYIPNIERSMRVAGTQRFMGGDFNNSDLLKVSLVLDYDGKLLDIVKIDGIECYYLDLRAKRSSTTYEQMFYWVRTKGFVPYKEEYYTLSGKKMKTLIYSDIGKLGSLVRPRKLTMINSLRPDHQTKIKMVNAKINIALPDSMFTRTYLERKRR